MEGNKFYKTDNGSYTPEQLTYLKQTNVFFFYTLQMLMQGKGNPEEHLAKATEFYTKIMNKDFKSVTKGQEMKNYIGKLRFLVLELKNNPDSREKFMKSPLVTDFMKKLTADETWEQWLDIESDDPNAEKSPLRASLACYRESGTDVPLGMNFPELISTVVKANPSTRRFYIDETANEETKSQLRQAADLQIESMTKGKFEKYFTKGTTAEKPSNENTEE